MRLYVSEDACNFLPKLKVQFMMHTQVALQLIVFFNITVVPFFNMFITYSSIFKGSLFSFSEKSHWKALWTDALKFGSDVVCVQESNFTSDNPPKFIHHKFSHIFYYNRKRKELLKEFVSFQLLDSLSDAQGRYIILVASIDNVTYTIAKMYASYIQPHKFIRKMLQKQRKNSERLCHYVRGLYCSDGHNQKKIVLSD